MQDASTKQSQDRPLKSMSRSKMRQAEVSRIYLRAMMMIWRQVPVNITTDRRVPSDRRLSLIDFSSSGRQSKDSQIPIDLRRMMRLDLARIHSAIPLLRSRLNLTSENQQILASPLVKTDSRLRAIPKRSQTKS